MKILQALMQSSGFNVKLRSRYGKALRMLQWLSTFLALIEPVNMETIF
jgi:hypothetical protein